MSINISDVQKDVYGVQSVQKFDIKFSDGAESHGKIINNVAYIHGIKAPVVNNEVKRGTNTYRRVLNELYTKGFKCLVINMQSSDSRVAIGKLIDYGILENPRGYTELDIDIHPTIFDISEKIKL